MFKKIVLLSLLISLFLPQIAFAKIIGPFTATSVLSQENMTQANNPNEEKLRDNFLKMRYASAISFYTLNDYANLLKIETSPRKSQEESMALLNSILNSLGFSGPPAIFSHNSSAYYLSVIWIQKSRAQQLNSKIAMLSESQKKCYVIDTYNMKIASNLNRQVVQEFEQTLISQGLTNIPQMNNLLEAIKFNAAATERIYQNMLSAGRVNKLNMMLPSQTANVPITSSDFKQSEDNKKITLKTTLKAEGMVEKQVLDRCYNESPNKADIKVREVYLFKLTSIYEKQENYTEALKIYKELILIDPTEPAIWYGRAMAKWPIGDTQGFLTDYNKSLSLGMKPDVNTYYIKAIAETMLGEYEKASNDFFTTYNLSTNNPSRSGLGIFALTYRQALKDGNGDQLKQKFLEENPLHFKTYLAKGGTLGKNNTPSVEQIKSRLNPTIPTIPNKSMCPPGTKPFLIVGRFKGTGTEVRFSTIAPVTKIKDIVDADSRFEYVRYMPIPESELNKYPRY